MLTRPPAPRPQRSDMCATCGKTWGKHFDDYCDFQGSDRTFVLAPEPVEQAAPPRGNLPDPNTQGQCAHCGGVSKHNDWCQKPKTPQPEHPSQDEAGLIATANEPLIKAFVDRAAAPAAIEQARPQTPELAEHARPTTPWIIWYDDADVKPDVFVGYGAEEAARKTYAARLLNWNCYLLTTAAAAEPAPERTPPQGNELSEFLYQNERIFDYVFYQLITPKKAIEAMGELMAGNKPALPLESEIDNAEENFVARAVAVPEPAQIEYIHLLTCSGNRKFPPGTRDISCSCRIISSGELQRLTELMTAVRDVLYRIKSVDYSLFGFKEHEKAAFDKLRRAEASALGAKEE